MKHLLLALLFAALPAFPASAQDTNSAAGAPPGPPPAGHHGMLTEAEKQQLRAAHDAAYQADPSLAAEDKDLKSKMDAFHEKVRAAMIKADPNVAPILAKIAAHHHDDGPNGPPPAN